MPEDRARKRHQAASVSRLSNMYVSHTFFPFGIDITPETDTNPHVGLMLAGSRSINFATRHQGMCDDNENNKIE